MLRSRTTVPASVCLRLHSEEVLTTVVRRQRRFVSYVFLPTAITHVRLAPRFGARLGYSDMTAFASNKVCVSPATYAQLAKISQCPRTRIRHYSHCHFMLSERHAGETCETFDPPNCFLFSISHIDVINISCGGGGAASRSRVITYCMIARRTGVLN